MPVRPLCHLILIALLACLVYSNTFQVPFDLDDRTSIVENPVIKDLSTFLSGAGYAYNPRRFIGYLTIALNYRLGGVDVTGYHIFNLAVHITAAWLVYALVRLTLRTPFFRGRSEERGTRNEDNPFPGPRTSNLVPLFAALLFVVHPVQTQAVTYVVQRFASLATMFYLLALVLYVKARLAAEERRVSAGIALLYLLSLLAAACAMKTKEIAFTLPFIAVLYEFSFFRTTARKRFLILLPVMLTVLIVPLSMLSAGKPLGKLLSDVSEAARQTRLISRGDYLLTQFSVIGTYLRLLVLPVNQNLDYDYPVYHSFFTPRVFFSFLFLVALLGLAVYLFFRSTFNVQRSMFNSHSPFTIHHSPFAGFQRLIAFGILWFFITLAVESSVVPIADVIFEHRLYLPSVGFFVALVAAAFWVEGKLTTAMPAAARLIIPAMGVVVLVFAGVAHARNYVWGDGVRLWEDVVRKSPLKGRGHSSLGVIYEERGRIEDAMRESLTAIRLDANDVRAHGNLGSIYAKMGLYEEAIREFRTALIIKPDYAEAHSGMGIVLASRGSFDEAIKELRTSIAIKAGNPDAYNNLGVVYAQQGRIDEAMEQFSAALRIMPENSEAHYNLGMAFSQQGRLDEAAREFKAAIRFKPDYTKAVKALEMIAAPQGGR